MTQTLSSDFVKESIKVVSNFLNKLYTFVQNIIIKESCFILSGNLFKVILKNYSLIFNLYHLCVDICEYILYLFDNVKMKYCIFFAICDATG